METELSENLSQTSDSISPAELESSIQTNLRQLEELLVSKGKGYNPPGFGFDRYLPYNMLSAITFLNEKLTRLMALEESRKVQSNSGYGISLQQKEQLRDLASFSVLTLAWIEELEFASST